MSTRLLILVFSALLISSPATAGNYTWGSIAAPSRVAGTELTGVASVQTPSGTNGAVQQFFVPTDGVLRKRTLAVGIQVKAIPPTGTPVSGGLGRLGGIFGLPAAGPSFHKSNTVAGGTIYFSGYACTDDWACRYGVFMRTCVDAACSKYLLPREAVGFPQLKDRDGWTQSVVASLDGWVFLLRVEEDKDETKFFEVWARNVRDGSPAERLAASSVGETPLSENMELVPGWGGQLTIVFSDIQRAALYVPDKGWKILP